MKKLEKKQIVVLIFVFALLLLVGGTYAYFSINASNDKTGAKVTGSATKEGNPTMQTMTKHLFLNLDASLMSQANAGKTYYANSDESGLALTTNPNYTLAIADLPEGDEILDCTYNYKVTATVQTAITDGSDSDVKVVVGDKTMALKEITDAGDAGIIVSGEFRNLVAGTSQRIGISSSVTNTSKVQDSLVGNIYTIKVEPYTSGDTKAFSCKLRYKIDSTKTLAQNLIDSGWLWQSKLEGDGYRYVGQGVTCSYDDGKYFNAANNQNTTPTCPTLYNFTRTSTSDGSTYNATYQTSCPSDTSSYTYTCTAEFQGSIINIVIPSNFICFGTADKAECLANQDKYMYRIIGVFSDTNGENHVKLIKYKQLGSYAWNANYETDISWENSDMYKGLNGSYFLTNTTYDYLQNTTWSNKIENWTWSAVNTKTYEDQTNNTSYYRSSPKGIYLNEMHKTSSETLCKNYGQTAVNCNGGVWTTPTGKIGLMYASDYALSLGSSALALTTGTDTNYTLLKTGWMHQSNNDTTKSTYEWALSRHGAGGGRFHAWLVDSSGYFNSDIVVGAYGSRPVFYLTNDVKITADGDGSLENPFILE